MKWIFFCPVTIVGYLFECIGAFKIAMFIYILMSKFKYPLAQYRLGILYADGDGVRVDIEKAKRLMKLASKGGYRDADEWLSDYENTSQNLHESLVKLIHDTLPAHVRIWKSIRATIWIGIISFGTFYIIFFKN